MLEWNPLTFVFVVLVVSYVVYAWINRGYLQKRWQLVNDKSFDWKNICVSAGWTVDEIKRTEFPEIATITIIKTLNCSRMGPCKVKMTIQGGKIKILSRNWKGHIVEQILNGLTHSSLQDWENDVRKRY